MFNPRAFFFGIEHPLELAIFVPAYKDFDTIRRRLNRQPPTPSLGSG
jgi:hypothetical protein